MIHTLGKNVAFEKSRNIVVLFLQGCFYVKSIQGDSIRAGNDGIANNSYFPYRRRLPPNQFSCKN